MVTFDAWIEVYQKIVRKFPKTDNIDIATAQLLDNLNRLIFKYENISVDRSIYDERLSFLNKIISVLNKLLIVPIIINDSEIFNSLSAIHNKVLIEKQSLYPEYQSTTLVKINDALNQNNKELARTLLLTDFAREHKALIMHELLKDSFDQKRADPTSQLTIDLLSELGVDFNAFNNKDETPLIRAVKSKQLNLVVALAQTNANVSIGSNWYSGFRGPLYYAADSLHVDCVKFLLSLNVDVSNTGILQNVIHSNNDNNPAALLIIELLIKAGMPLINDSKSINPLKTAVCDGKLEFVKLLFKFGAPLYPDIVSDAIKSLNVELLEYLHSLNNPQIIFPTNIPYLKDSDPAKCIIKSPSLPMFQLCVLLGMPLSEYVIFDRLVLQTPMAVNMLAPTLDIPNLPQLPNPFSDSRLDYMHPGKGICSLPHIAATFAVRESLAVLIAAGLDIHAKDQHGLTPLHYASLYGNLDTLKILIFAGAKLDAQDNNQMTPLHWAAKAIHKADNIERYLDCVKVLLFSGAHTDILDKDRKTPNDYWNTNGISKEKWETAFATRKTDVKPAHKPEFPSLLQITCSFFANNKQLTENLLYRKQLPSDLSDTLELIATQGMSPSN